MFPRRFAALVPVLLLLSVSYAPAIGPAIPGDFFDYEVSITGDPGDGYYYLDPDALGATRRSYAVVLNTAGEVVFFRDDGNLTNFQRHSGGGYSWTVGRASFPEAIQLLDDGFEPTGRIDADHPTDPDLTLDGHEYLRMPDGSSWTLWWEDRSYDMSEYLEGGLEDVTVHGHVIQHTSADGELLWQWRSLDHLDTLPFTARLDSTTLYRAEFEHLHVNSIDPASNAVYLSSRTMSVVIKVDRATGDVLWRLGGGPANDFTFTGDPPAGVPLTFNFQHDARMHPGGELTVYDNGLAHIPARSYARRYTLDESAMTAELTWVYQNSPSLLARITGNHTVLADGNHLVGWGNRFPSTAFTEVTEDGNEVFRLEFAQDPVTGVVPGSYRVRKSDSFTAEANPYLSAYIADDYLELACNWFGHEDEVASYDVYGGYSANALVLLGNTTTGYHYSSEPVFLQPYFYRIVAKNAAGQTISPPSNLLQVQTEEAGLRLTRVSPVDLPVTGGTLVYTATVTNTSGQAFSGLQFITRVELPNGNTVGPLLQVPFSMQPYSQQTVTNLTQAVPGFAAPGDYQFVGFVGVGETGYSDSFPFSKAGGPHGPSNSASARAWPAGGGWPDTDVAGASSSQPTGFALAPVTPNPFNARAELAVTLPSRSALQLAVFNPLGRRVMTVHHGPLPAGRHRFTIDAGPLASGVYFVRAATGDQTAAARKMVVLK